MQVVSFILTFMAMLITIGVMTQIGPIWMGPDNLLGSGMLRVVFLEFLPWFTFLLVCLVGLYYYIRSVFW